MGVFIVQQAGVISSGGTPLGTYTPAQAVDLCREFLHGYPTLNVQARACDAVNSYIWMAYPWRWTIKVLPAFSLTDGVQDYANIPIDILRLMDARVVKTSLTPSPSRELDIKTYFSPETIKRGYDSLAGIAIEPATGVFRLDSVVGITSPDTLQIQGRYQFLPPRITDADMDTIFYFPDIYFECYVEGLKWKFYQLADDTRAGAAATDNHGKTTYNGQLAVFIDSLEKMKEMEDYADAEQFTFPDESLGIGRSGNTGLFGR